MVDAEATLGIGTDSAKTVPDKLQRHGIKSFHAPDSDLPLVHGCVGWLLCKVMPEPRNH